MGDLNADGVIATAWQLDDVPAVLHLAQTGAPVVGVGFRCRGFSLPSVCTDNFRGVRRAVQLLLESGHCDIGLVTHNVHNGDVHERLLGFGSALARAGHAVEPAHLLMTCYARDASLLEGWWSGLRQPPTALIVDSMSLMPMLRILERAGMSTPRDVSLIVIDELREPGDSLLKITVIRQPVVELGRRVVSKLVEILHGDDDGSPEILPTELVLGDSVAAPRARA
jgi:LacI family transcriptional regulator